MTLVRWPAIAAAVSVRILRSVFRCNHTHVGMTEGKNICPHCGDAVVVRWAVLRCMHCNHKRAGHHALGIAMADDVHCHECGATDVVLEYLESPPFYQLRKAFLVVEPESTFLMNRRAEWLEKGLSKTKAWFDSSVVAPTSQPIKALCRLS